MGQIITRALAAVVLAGALSACEGGGAGQHLTPVPTPQPQQAIALALRTARTSAGYTVTMTGHNFLLPRWGGIDGATLRVATNGAAVSGSVDRTGDGSYDVLFTGGQTFFQRSTCDHQTRVPGGGANVFTPFLIASNGDLERATDLAYVQPTVDTAVAIKGRFGDLGVAVIELDARTYEPRRLAIGRDPASGTEAVWLFTDWGRAPDVQPPHAPIPDNGPGGNPC